MNRLLHILLLALPLSASSQNPADQLPPHTRRLTWFGERAD